MDHFARSLLDWFEHSGRHDLPWQRDRHPYRVWVSEVMLQQTQAVTVAPYYERFVARFPTVAALGQANVDDVLALWSGLGYYARARNLHRAAVTVSERDGGELPADLEGLMDLPGIGRSTAAAILALSAGRRFAILDGNVKRVLARYHAVEGWPGIRAIERLLWQHAEAHTPHEQVADYTQAIMDLGAMVCARSNPACNECPVSEGCQARQRGLQQSLPSPRPRRARPRRRCKMLVVMDVQGGRVLLERRPSTGVWGGLFSLPELPAEGDVADWCKTKLGVGASACLDLEPIHHVFTHFEIDLEPILVKLDQPPRAVMDRSEWTWHCLAAEAPSVGVASPIRKLLHGLSAQLESAESRGGEDQGSRQWGWGP